MKRQGQVIAALLNNFESVESSLATMTNSAGGAMQEMEIIQESLSFKLNELKVTSEGIFQNLFPRDQMGVVIDFLTKILSFVDLLTTHLGLLGTALTAGAIFKGIKSIS